MNSEAPATGDHAVPGLLRVARGIVPPTEVPEAVDRYHGYFAGDAGQRQRDYASVVNTYYDLVTDFYEYGWGQSFHFAPRAHGETFRESLLRHEQWLALRLGLSPDKHVLDVGCGVGGPMRTIARFAGCTITGLNNNDYQVARAGMHNRRVGLDARCDVVKGDFMAMPFPDAHFDAAYAIEATVHAPDLASVYAEIGRVLKPGGVLASYEWAMTERFIATDGSHQRIRRDIAVVGEAGAGTQCDRAAPDIRHWQALHQRRGAAAGDAAHRTARHNHGCAYVGQGRPDAGSGRHAGDLHAWPADRGTQAHRVRREGR